MFLSAGAVKPRGPGEAASCRLLNEQIAEATYLSINTVKTYIRTAYRKMGVTRRSQAVLLGVEHGFQPQPKMVLDVDD
jgi:two-component system, NarL family, response regulator LiaR